MKISAVIWNERYSKVNFLALQYRPRDTNFWNKKRRMQDLHLFSYLRKSSSSFRPMEFCCWIRFSLAFHCKQSFNSRQCFKIKYKICILRYSIHYYLITVARTTCGNNWSKVLNAPSFAVCNFDARFRSQLDNVVRGCVQIVSAREYSNRSHQSLSAIYIESQL